MAVHPQKLISDLALDTGLCNKNSAAAIDLDHHQRQPRLLLASHANPGLMASNFGASVLATGQQSSEFTCNGTTSVSAKRAGGDDPSRHCFVDLRKRQNEMGSVENSTVTSTSGRSTCSIVGGGNLISCLYHQSVEVDALIRVQGERLRSQLDEANRRHYRAVVSALERQMQGRLAEKESELQCVKRRRLELEERLAQVAAENQVWISVARNNEAAVATLRSTLEKALIRQHKEGFGETDDDAASYSSAPSPACKGCGGAAAAEVCVLLLPCRHLCLCKPCESKTDTCPICRTPRNATVQVVFT